MGWAWCAALHHALCMPALVDLARQPAALLIVSPAEGRRGAEAGDG